MATYGIALSGKQLSGKTTTKRALAATLRSKHYEVVELSFAAPLKERVCELVGVNMAELDAMKTGQRGDLIATLTRCLLQYIGQKERAVDEDFWVKKLLDKVVAADHRVYLIDDARFENEVRALQARGFFVARLDTTPEAQAAHGVVKNPLDASETALDAYSDFDTRIDSDHMTPEEMAACVYFDFAAGHRGEVVL